MTTKTEAPRMALVATRSQDLPDGSHAEPGDEVNPELFHPDGVYWRREDVIDKWVTYGHLAWRSVTGKLPKPKKKK